MKTSEAGREVFARMTALENEAGELEGRAFDLRKVVAQLHEDRDAVTPVEREEASGEHEIPPAAAPFFNPLCSLGRGPGQSHAVSEETCEAVARGAALLDAVPQADVRWLHAHAAVLEAWIMFVADAHLTIEERASVYGILGVARDFLGLQEVLRSSAWAHPLTLIEAAELVAYLKARGTAYGSDSPVDRVATDAWILVTRPVSPGRTLAHAAAWLEDNLGDCGESANQFVDAVLAKWAEPVSARTEAQAAA